MVEIKYSYNFYISFRFDSGPNKSHVKLIFMKICDKIYDRLKLCEALKVVSTIMFSH